MSRLPPLTLNAWLRFDLVTRTLATLDGVESVLEVGAGEGAAGARLARLYRYVGVEPDEEACAVARSRVEPAGKVVCGEISDLESGSLFDLVCAFEVLEHIEDDEGAVRTWREYLRPGGWIMLSVPPHQRRFSHTDVGAGHFRRYDPPKLGALLERCGFVEPRLLMYGFPVGHALEFARNLVHRLAPPGGTLAERTASSGRRLQPPDSLGWLTATITAPMRLLQRPFFKTRLGSGLVAVARRSD
jgi:SAM-dependent methyltransferase